MVELINITNELLLNFNVEEATSILLPTIFFILGVVIYSIFIFKFYRFIAKRDIFELNLAKYNAAKHGVIRKIFRVIFYIIEHVLLFPLIAFLWFITFTILLIFLTKTQTVNNVLLVSITVVSGIRITAYYDEELSKDLAKMLPFALLGVFLVDISYFSLSNSITAIWQLPTFWKVMVYYLLFVIVLELILRIAHGILGKPTKKEAEK